MIEALYKGILLGFVLMISVGPIFFAVLETSISKGFWYAFSISIGTVISDSMYIAFAYYGLSNWFDDEVFRMWMGISGGFVLIIVGITYILKKTDMHAADLHIRKASYTTYLVKGFLINTLNPFVIFFWISALGWASLHFNNDKSNQLVFFFGVLATIFSSDMLKAFLAGKIKHIITFKVLHWVNRIAGIVMIFFGAELMWKVIFGKGI